MEDTEPLRIKLCPGKTSIAGLGPVCEGRVTFSCDKNARSSLLLQVSGSFTSACKESGNQLDGSAVDAKIL